MNEQTPKHPGEDNVPDSSYEPFCIQITNGEGPPQRIYPGRSFTVGIHMLGDDKTLHETVRLKGSISSEGVLRLSTVSTIPPVVRSKKDSTWATDPYYKPPGRGYQGPY